MLDTVGTAVAAVQPIAGELVSYLRHHGWWLRYQVSRNG